MKPFISRSLIPGVRPIKDKLAHEDIPPEFLPKEDQKPLMKSIETTDIPQDNIYEAERIIKHKIHENGDRHY